MNYNYAFQKIALPCMNLEDDYSGYLETHGYVLLDVGSNFTNARYIELMKQFGIPLNEGPLVDKTYVEDGCILNLRTTINTNISSDNEPFSISGLTMHMERAFSPNIQQPNYLSLYCVEAPAQENGGQTILYPMKNFMSHFTTEELGLMRRLHVTISQAHITSPQGLISEDPIRNIEYVSFRDPGVFGVDWKFEEGEQDTYISLVIKIKEALYDKHFIKALDWKPGYLYIFDNKKNFHARTEQNEISNRHLKRIRVV